MLEREQDQFPEGIRLVGAKLSSTVERPPAEQTPPRPTRAQALAVDRFERTSPVPDAFSVQPVAPVLSGMTREHLLILGMGAALIVLILIVMILLLL
jgi:hypothetical protein